MAPLLLTAQSSASPVAQRAPDIVKTRAGTVLTGQLLYLDEWLVRMSTGTLSRSDVDWIALGAAEPPRQFPEVTAYDIALLASGELLAGRIVSFDGSTLAFDDGGGRRNLSIGQVLALTFCDAPCSVGASGPPASSSSVGGSGLSPTPYGGTGFGASPAPTFLPGLAGGSTIPTTFGPSPMSGTPEPSGAPDTCHGDEQISFSPAESRVGDELLVAVTSARPYAYPRLTGTEPPTFLRNRAGQLGFVYEWTVRPTWPGLQQYVFYVDSTIRCAEQHVEVRRALTTPTPKPYGIFAGNDNNSNDSNDDGDNDNVAPTLTRISFATSTPLPVGPSRSVAGTMCSTFTTQAQAQAYLRANPTDPLTMDRNRNGIACEGADGASFMNPPFDQVPVPRP